MANPSSCNGNLTNAKNRCVLHLHPLDQFPLWKSHGRLRQRSRGKWHIRQNSLRPAVCLRKRYFSRMQIVQTIVWPMMLAAFARSRHCPSSTCRKISSWIAMIGFVRRNIHMAPHRKHQNIQRLFEWHFGRGASPQGFLQSHVFPKVLKVSTSHQSSVRPKKMKY